MAGDFKKNDLVTLKITDMGNDGEGIGKVDGYTLFVKDAVIGDVIQAKVIKAKKNYGYGRLEKILEASLYRVEPRCAYARQCGGCQLQAMSYERQLQYKADKVCNNLMRIGGMKQVPLESVMGMEEPYGYRNKAQFPVGVDRNGRIITGFYAGRTHTIVENRSCHLGVPENEQILDIVLSHMEKHQIAPYDEKTGRGLMRHILTRYGFRTKEIMVCLVINGDRIKAADELVECLQTIHGITSIMINVNRKQTNVILGDELKTLWGQPYITDYIGNVAYQISPLSFYQVNPVQTEKMYGKALEYADLKGNETVWDLYCGIGTISLFLARKAKQIYGVEIVPQAVEDARRNAKLNGIENASFYVGKAEEVLPEKYEKEGVRADVIVVDPPRKGCDEVLLNTIVKMEPERVVYVSCDSATLARDVKYLHERGYEVGKVSVVDNFCQTVHVETVVLLQRKNM